MSKPLAHVRSNAIAYLALFIALGGTSYAAIRLPANSVGNRQLRNGAVTDKKLANGAITPAKLDGRDIAGSVAMWARVSANGDVIASEPRAATVGWSLADHAGRVSWDRPVPNRCFALATVDGFGTPPGFASVVTLHSPVPAAAGVVVGTFATTGQPSAAPVNVAVICP